jgi:penicillin-binding protein 1A
LKLRRKLWAIARWTAIVVTLLFSASLLAIAFVIRRYEAELPSTEELQRYSPPQVTRVLARDGTLLGEIFIERRTVVPIERIPKEMKLAVLAAEDAAFYEHAGLNYLGMLRALAVNIRSSQARQGGSTITQQVVKNVLLNPERTLDRKIREVILARRIEQELSKDQILELYLNHIYFGHGRYGVEEASRYYFGKSIENVTLAEAALLAGIVKGPGHYSPRVNPAGAIQRRTFVLGQMLGKGFARPEHVKAAQQEPVVLAAETEVMSELSPEVVAEAQRTLRILVGSAADRGGYTITTTIDPALQAAARTAVRKNLDDFAKRHKTGAPLTKSKKEPPPFEGVPKTTGHRVFQGIVTGADDASGMLFVRVGTIEGAVSVRDSTRYNPNHLTPSQFAQVGKVLRVSFADPRAATALAEGSRTDEVDESAAGEDLPQHPPAVRPKLRLELAPESALVAVDIRTREIIALIGSYEGLRGGLDRASSAHRQPGSTFKPFVYSYAIHTRTMTPASILETNPLAIPNYRPANYDESEGQSPKRMRPALAHSVNVAAVWTLNRLGPSNVVAWAQSLGFESKLGPDLSLALGSYEVTPREMAGAYATFAAGGIYETPVLIQKIMGPNGVELPLPPRAPSRRVMDEAEAYVVTSLLTSVVQQGTGKRALALSRPVAGKTGTSNQAKDTWFVGYTPDIACAVWTGFDDAVPLGFGETGATAALPAFLDFMQTAHRRKPPTDFSVPPGIVHVSIDPSTGLRSYPGQPDAIEEIFLAGTEPSGVAAPDAGTEEEAAPPEESGSSTPALPTTPEAQPESSPLIDTPPF